MHASQRQVCLLYLLFDSWYKFVSSGKHKMATKMGSVICSVPQESLVENVSILHPQSSLCWPV